MVQKEGKTDNIFLEDKEGLVSTKKSSKTDGIFLSVVTKLLEVLPLTTTISGIFKGK